MKIKASLLLVILACVAHAEIKHKFLVYDEAGKQLAYVDEFDSSNNWKLKIDSRSDIHRMGEDKIFVPKVKGHGVYIVDLKTRSIIDEKTITGHKGKIWSVSKTGDDQYMVIGTLDNTTIIASLLDSDLKMIQSSVVTNAPKLRFARPTAEGHALAAPDNQLVEWSLDGKIEKRIPLEGVKNAFLPIKDEKGNYWVSTGYTKSIRYVDPDGKTLKEFKAPANLKPGFHAGFDWTPNGNVIVTSWHGHKPKNAKKGVQLIEYNPQGEVVWTYHNTNSFSCPLAIIVFE